MPRRFHEDFPVTSLLLLLVVGFYVLEVLAQPKLVDDPDPGISFWAIDGVVFQYLGGMIPRDVVEGGEVWRLLSAAFLHAGLIHLLFNSLVLLDLGRFCEPLLSPYKFCTVYVTCALGGSAARCLWAYTASGHPRAVFVPSVGASGALMGLIGLLLVYSVKERHRHLRESLVRWIIFIVLITVLVPAVDHAAHAGGFVTGCLFGLTVKDYMTSSAAQRWKAPSYAVGAALGAALLFAVWNYFSHLWERG